MTHSPRRTSAGIVRTDASLPLSLSHFGMKRLTSAPWAALALGLVFASFHLACLAEARNSDNSTLTTQHPDPGSLEQCPSKLLLATGLTPELALNLGGKSKPACFLLVGVWWHSACLAFLCPGVVCSWSPELPA
ncbi:unnamed protein product [Gulo gulo]|uniref:Uncharacterized protein n=1 Tax=Gulo gulo TaxID=48420 RepID=A0A9X9PYQ6_GULGU|nr:unnamed protein product [Gulo gulo]